MHYNIFEYPQYYRNLILQNNVLNFEKKRLNGKSLACIFLTRFCSVGCSFCFFKSPPSWKGTTVNDQFNDDGIDKFIQFSREANLGYILVSGGGEPLNRKKHILKIIEEAQSDRIVLVTSGSWAQNYNTALNYIQDMYKCLRARKTPTHLVIRVSVSDYHAVKLGIYCAENIIDIFNKHFSNHRDFSLQIKAFEGDKALQNLLSKINASIDYNNAIFFESDNNILDKKIPKKIIATLPSGYKLNIGISCVFYSSIKPNLNHIESLKNGIRVFEEDLRYSENYNSTLIFNKDKTEGLDWSIGYNGNICTWQNQSQDNYMNLYDSSYESIIASYMRDPLTYSVIDKGNLYREMIISEVNDRAVLRSKAMGLRDCVGAVLFEEERTRLYYTLRVIQDYIDENRIASDEIRKWPQVLSNIVSLSKQDLIKQYNESSHNIIKQQQKKPFNEIEWYDLFELIKLGHYTLSTDEIEEAISYYNKQANNKINSLSEIPDQGGDIVRRLTERLVKPREILEA